MQSAMKKAAIILQQVSNLPSQNNLYFQKYKELAQSLLDPNNTVLEITQTSLRDSEDFQGKIVDAVAISAGQSKTSKPTILLNYNSLYQSKAEMFLYL